jgi:hypothetical protein
VSPCSFGFLGTETDQMKLFVSYRREDTGGRAGRLCAVLVTRFGAGNVFQDVNAVSPGHDFRAQVEAAIATSDAVLIVIGPGWLQSDGADVGRRIDDENDFVRLEVSLALSSGVPVVPVLVDGAVLPSLDELPDDMAEMLGRHAVTIRDASWHQDVDDLISRLKGEERLASRTRRWPITVGVGLLIVFVVFVVAAIVRNPSEQSSASGWPECKQPDENWVQVELAADPTDEIVDDDAHTVGYEVLEAAVLVDSVDSARVMVEVAATNGSEPRQGDDDPKYFGPDDIDGLFVDGVQFEIDCIGPLTGSGALDPGERAIAWTGFTTIGIPTGVPLLIELDSDARVDIGTSP